MRAVVDSSSWISLARAGLLNLLPAMPVEAVLLDVVHDEIVAQGRRGGHPDAAALSAVVADIPVVRTEHAKLAIDSVVLSASADAGVLVANDLALGRRARSLGVQWIRTADLIILATKSGSMTRPAGREALRALEASGRITPELAGAYLEQLR